MAFEYLPVMAQNSAPKPPRVLVALSKPAWSPVKNPVSQSRIALLSSAALRLPTQQPFIPREDLSYRRIHSDPDAGAKSSSTTIQESAAFPSRTPRSFFRAAQWQVW